MSAEREALRQQMLLRALWRDAGPASLQGWVRTPGPARDARAGLAAYQANAGALAERALAGAYPTVAALVGDESFAALARDFWRRHPPARGDIGEWGDALPGFIADSESLASEAYLADSARLDWLVHAATRAADAAADPLELNLLADTDPSRLRLRLNPGGALLSSEWPVVAIWQAHQRAADQADRFADVRAAFDAGQADTAWVRREGYGVRVDRVDDATAAFTRALLEGRTLAAALDLSDSGFAFDQWLARAIGSRWIAAIQPIAFEEPPS